jgi:hypothetical protein
MEVGVRRTMVAMVTAVACVLARRQAVIVTMMRRRERRRRRSNISTALPLEHSNKAFLRRSEH